MMKHSIRLARQMACLLLVLSIFFLTSCQPTDSPVAPSDSPSPSLTAPADSTPEPQEPVGDAQAQFAPFSPAINATIARVTDSASLLPEGLTWEDNPWTQAYEELLGVTFTTAWSGDESQMAMEIQRLAAEGTLPDYMVLPYDLFYSLAKQGLLEPLDKAVSGYASPDVLNALDAHDGAARQVASVDGVLYGITSAPPREGMMLWYRNDWMEATGRTSPPSTFEEVIEMAYDFLKNPMEQDAEPVGLGLDRNLFVGGPVASSSLGLEGIFSAYGLYPTQWQEIDGELMHGSVNPEVITVLELLQTWYKDGLIDASFDELDPWSDIQQNGVFADRIGMAFAPEMFSNYAVDLMNVHGENPPTWTCMPIPGASGAANRVPTLARQQMGQQGYVTCVRSGYAYPELAVKMVNLTQSLLHGEHANAQYQYVIQDNMRYDITFLNMAAGGHLTDNTTGDTTGARAQLAAELQSALSTQDPNLDAMSEDLRTIYERCVAWQAQEEDATPQDYRLFLMFGPGGTQAVTADLRSRDLLMPDAYYGPETSNFRDYWPALMEKRNECYIRIIKGADAERTFNEYVQFFDENGGSACTQDANDWFAAN